MKGLRASFWRTKDILIEGKNPTDINFTTIGNQVRFIDSIKYFQQSLGGLASSLTSSEKTEIRKQYHSFFIKTAKAIFKIFEIKSRRSILDTRVPFYRKRSHTLPNDYRL